MNDFLAIGSSTVDLLLHIEDIERIDLQGQFASKLVCISFASKTEIGQMDVRPGGSAANSAVTISRLGGKAALQACIGGGLFSKIITEDLKKWKIDSSGVKIIENEQSAVGMEIISGGEKSAMIYRGAGSLLGPSHYSKKLIDQSKRIFFTSLTSEKNFALFKKIVQYSEQKNKTIVFAPSISMLHKFKDQLHKLESHFDLVIMNEEEANYYTGNRDIVDSLNDLPGRVKVITAAVNGAWAKQGRKIYHVPAHKVTVVDTTGAGDSFSGAFAYTFYKTDDIKKALKIASTTAAMKLTKIGARYTFSQGRLKDFMKTHPMHVTERIPK